jgi:hypothetical protein
MHRRFTQNLRDLFDLYQALVGVQLATLAFQKAFDLHRIIRREQASPPLPV